MAKQIDELGAAGAVVGANLFWLEQAGIPTKLSYTALVSALGSLPTGSVTDAVLRWDGAAWVEETDARISASSGTMSTIGSVRAGGHAGSTTVIHSSLEGPVGMAINVGTAAGGWARGVAVEKVSDGLRLGGYGYLGSNESITSWHVGFGADWWAADSVLDITPTTANLIVPLTIDTDAAGAALTIGDGTSVSGDILLHFDMDRSWDFKSLNEDASNSLVLNSRTAGKSFLIQEVDVTSITLASGGNITTVGDVTADNFEATGLGPLTTPGTDDAYFGGYGAMGSRGVFYVSNVAGSVVLNHTGVHNVNTKLATTAGGVDVTGQMHATHTTAGTAAILATNAGTANMIAQFVGDTDSLDILTVGAGDYQIRNSGQGNGITIYDGTGGIDIEYNNVTAISCDNGNDVTLFFSGVEEAWTQDSNASGQTSGFATNDYGGTKRDVGFATMEEVTFTANTVVTADHWSQKAMTHTNATTHTLTFNTLSTVPNGAVMWVKARTGIVTLVDGTMVLTLYAGAALTTGNISVAIGGWATLHKTGNSAADVTGVGLT